VGLLTGGLIGGVYLGQAQHAKTTADSQASLVGQAEIQEIRLLKERHGQHAAARAHRQQAEAEAASVAAAEAKAAAGKARELEKKAIAKKAAEKKAKEEAEADKDVPYTGRIPASCNEFSGNRAIGCALMLDDGFGIGEFPCLNKLWTRESGWNHRAENSGSGAYGIPQAYPGSKMKSAGSDWKTNPATQIKWGLGYIKDRYDSPCGAWSYFQNNGSY
jgi:hypothetical protein